MKIYPKCVPCLLRRAYYEVNMSDVSEEKRYKAIESALDELSEEFSGDKATFEVSSEMHRAVYDEIEKNDPYSEKKEIGNEFAKKLLEVVKEEIKGSEDSFRKSVVASIISNSLDFGVLEHEVDIDELTEEFPNKLKKADLGIDDVDEIKKEIIDAEKIAFVVDNCGEVVFDKILIEEIKKISDAEITLYVRGEPIFNDVTLKEAKEVEITDLSDEVKELGGRAVGVHPKYVPEEIKEELFSSDLIISKGMANYESFSEINQNNKIAYLFKTKCEPVADSIGVSVGENIAYLDKP